MSLFSGDDTKKQLEGIYKAGLEKKEPYWNFGYPILSKCVCDLESGLWFVVAPENVGKSQFQVNLGYNVLKYNSDAYWLDFMLDNSATNRYSYLLACAGGLPISLITCAGDAPEEQKGFRKEVIGKFGKEYGDRYRLIAEDKDNDYDFNIFDVNVIAKLVGEARQGIGKDAKLFVTIDGFHDVIVSSAGSEETTQQKHKSQTLKKVCNKFNALICCTAHTRKDSRKRNLTADIMKGEDTPLFDSMVVSHLYSDYNYNREAADIWWDSTEEPGIKLPVHELDILKNKAGPDKKVIFYNHYPSRCCDYEVDEDFQDIYRQMIFKKIKKKQ